MAAWFCVSIDAILWSALTFCTFDYNIDFRI
jgi:hypothetical protein